MAESSGLIANPDDTTITTHKSPLSLKKQGGGLIL